MRHHDPARAAQAIHATADNLAANHARVTALVSDWSGTLTRTGDGGASSKGDHSDPTCTAAMAHDEFRGLEENWRRALSDAEGWARQINGPLAHSLTHELHVAADMIATPAMHVGQLNVGRLYSACTRIDDIIGATRSAERTPDDVKPTGPKVCRACRTEYQNRGPLCEGCKTAYRRNQHMTDEEFDTMTVGCLERGEWRRAGSPIERTNIPAA